MLSRALTALLIVLSVALIAAVAVLLLRDDESFSLTAGEPQIVSEEQLAEFSDEADGPVYWLGPREQAEYELTETSSGRVYVRYLDGEAEAGDPRSDFVTVGTYPLRRAAARLVRAAREQPQAKLRRVDDGAIVLIDPSSTDNAYLAYPGTDSQVEVFSPVPGQALRLSMRGAVRPVG